MNHPPARGPRYRQLPLWRDAQRLLLEVELAVRAFARYHKYTLGSELRRQAMDVNRLVARAAQRLALRKQSGWWCAMLGAVANTPRHGTGENRRKRFLDKRQQLSNAELVPGWFAPAAANPAVLPLIPPCF